ncbi:DEKNAAC105409 [Brettanomyces naardenensis]|uniref:DEKNAAC105409 n=1 Tax=Brettanomyces naardenensis TaxID=13370 RepID=A0A448YTB1_BRENA|nr:DEKNAAC105409 [Brettanomyces naardenensis]
MLQLTTALRSARLSSNLPLIARRLQSTVAEPKKTPSAKGVLFGFFAGASLAGLGCYYYLMDEYKATSNAIVTDVLRLQRSVENLEKHVTNIENELAKKEK